MMNSGKCPKCEKELTYVLTEKMPIHALMDKKWRGISYVCPFCKLILGVSIDPLSIE
jgi:hypothetical protein